MVAAPPTAELEPIREGSAAQTDEQDMGMTYEVGRTVRRGVYFGVLPVGGRCNDVCRHCLHHAGVLMASHSDVAIVHLHASMHASMVCPCRPVLVQYSVSCSRSGASEAAPVC